MHKILKGFLLRKSCAYEVWLAKENLLTGRIEKRRTSSLVFFCMLHLHNEKEEKETYGCVERENFYRRCRRTRKSARAPARMETDVMKAMVLQR